eukprot:COSAG06_NODE_1559_length_9106_cov_6.943599_7_plen_64_part_00
MLLLAPPRRRPPLLLLLRLLLPSGCPDAAMFEMKHDISRASSSSARVRTLVAPSVIENQNGMP